MVNRYWGGVKRGEQRRGRERRGGEKEELRCVELWRLCDGWINR
jgi:hypothetical protein